jgi:hydroxymethylbilane synthase
MQHVPLRSEYKVGTRESQLARIQTARYASLSFLFLLNNIFVLISVIAQLQTFYPGIQFKTIPIKTTGDKNLSTPLANIGDKGLFTKELEAELDKNNIDFVVHSLKDVPSTTLPPNMIIGAILERADPRDALVVAPWRNEKSLDQLPVDSVIGTSSTRRIAQLKLKYPKLIYKNIRGNMNTRWEKLNTRELGYDAMIVAVAGFQRLEWTHRISEIIEPDKVLYAIGQGALGIECRHNDKDTIQMLSVLNHEPTVIRCIAERAFLKRSNYLNDKTRL